MTTKKRRFLLPLLPPFLFLLTFSLAGQSGWDGNAGSGYADDFPPTGNWGLSNAFVPNSAVLVTNLENNRQLRVTILGRKEESSLFLVLSPAAAQELGIGRQTPTRVRVNPLSGGEYLDSLTEPALHPDSDINPLANRPPSAITSRNRISPPAPREHTLIAPNQRSAQERAPLTPEESPRGAVLAPPATHERREVAELEVARDRRQTLRPVRDSGAGIEPALKAEPLLPVPVEPKPEQSPTELVPVPPPPVTAVPPPPVTAVPPPLPPVTPEESVERAPVPQPPKEYRAADEIAEELLRPSPLVTQESPVIEEPSPAPSPEQRIVLEATQARPAQSLALPQKSARDIEQEGRYIQIGAFKDSEAAKQLVAQLRERELQIFSYSQIATRGNLTRVLIGPIKEDEYGSLLQWLRSQGFTDAFSRRGAELL